MNKILELLLKYHFHTFMTSIEIFTNKIKPVCFIREMLFNEIKTSFWNY